MLIFRPGCAVLFFIAYVSVASAQDKALILFIYDKDNFTARGNWTPSDPKEKSGFPSETQIDCLKNGMSCVEATAQFFSGHPHVLLNYLKVVKWDNNGIIATDSTGTCMTETVQISFADKRISSTHSVKQLDKETKQFCEFFGADMTHEEVFVLENSERWNKEHSFLPEKSEK